MQQRKTKQKDEILNNLKNRYDHPTATELFLSVRESIPNISIATLYRNLKSLSESNEIFSFSIGDEVHYDANTNQHYHLHCRKCNRFYDLPVIPLEELQNLVIPEFNGVIENYNLIFYGICENCVKNN